MLPLRSSATRTGTGSGMRSAAAGFTLIEVLLASALFAVLAFGAFEMLRLFADASRRTAAHAAAYASVERVAGQLRAEARSATAVWSSSASAGTGADGCTQLDFYAADAAGPAFWSYRTFPHHAASDAVPSDALQRVAATAPIAPCDASPAGTLVLRGLTAPMSLTTTAPNALASHADPVLGTADSTFIAATVPATAPVPLGVLDASGAPVAGGNALVEAVIATSAASFAIDLVPGTPANGFTEVLRYTCTARCDVGHDTAAPKTLTSCAASWQTAWSTMQPPSGWFIGGTFTFTYAGTRAGDGGTDTLAKPYAASNWDPSRDYVAYPPNGPAADGSETGSVAPWNAIAEDANAWFGAFAPYVAANQRAAIAAEQARCASVNAQGTSGGFYANG